MKDVTTNVSNPGTNNNTTKTEQSRMREKHAKTMFEKHEKNWFEKTATQQTQKV